MANSQANATYSGLQFTMSTYGAFDLSDVKKQVAFDEASRKEALGGDEEIFKAEQKWQEYFGDRPIKSDDFEEFDLTPGSLNYISPAPKKYSGLASGMRLTIRRSNYGR